MKCDGRLIRVIRPEFVKVYQALLAGSFLLEQCQAGTVSAFRILDMEEAVGLIGAEVANCLCLEHEVIGFPSYSSEWPLEMLCAAAELTLNLCQQSLKHGIGLKDATPQNILFLGPFPTFVDILSFELRDACDPTWLAYGQFVRSFLLPALLNARHTIPCHSTLLAHHEGIEPEEVYRLLSPLARFTPPFLGNVTMPVLLSASAERHSSKVYARKKLSNSEKATFILQSMYSSLGRNIQSSSTRKHSLNTWGTYNETCTYSKTDFSQKTVFVEQFLQAYRPSRLLDVGCNTGHFSFLAARYGAQVVAIDLDPEVVGNLWQRAKREQAKILPLVVNLAKPTPAMGWRNRETASFLDRAEGYFDVVFMLAVVHHLLVTEQIPLDEIIEQAYRLTTDWLVIEYVSPEDPQFKRLLRGREGLFGRFGRCDFEIELNKRFTIVSQNEVAENGRWLYLARRLNAHLH